MTVKSFIPILMVATLLLSCRGDRQAQRDRRARETDAAFFEKARDIRDVYYRFPSPREMLAFIDSTGFSFMPQVLNPIAHIDNYLTSLDQALNMGVYIADLGYITLFQRYKESLDYLQAVYQLSEWLRISAAFDKEMINRIDHNLKNIDSLEAISEDAFTGIVDYLSRNDMEAVFGVISIGGFIEAMHILISLSGNYSTNNPNIQKIFDQKFVFNNILKYSQEYQDDANMVIALEMVKPLAEFYQQVGTETEPADVRKNTEGKLVFGGKASHAITPEQFNALKKIIFDIRNKITHG